MMRYCFSTEVVDLNNQAPNRNKRESRYFWDELNHLIAAGGFHSIEVPYEPKWDFGGRSGIPRSLRSITVKFETVKNYMGFLRDNGIEGIDCIHFDPSLFCQGQQAMYFGAAQHFAQEAVSFAAQAGCPVVTISVTPPAWKVWHLEGYTSDEEFLKETGKLVENLYSQAQEQGVCLCLKNEFWSLLRGLRITEFLDSLNADVKLDLDTANLYIAGADISEVLNSNDQRIGVVHLTDASFIDTDNVWKTPIPEFPEGRATKVFTDPG